MSSLRSRISAIRLLSAMFRLLPIVLPYNTPMPNSPSVFELLLARYPSARKTTLRDMVADKRVLLNGVPVKSLKQPVGEADKLEILDTPAPRAQTLDEGLRLVYQDADVLIVDKPAGLLTATDAHEQRPTVLAILSAYVQRTNHRARALLIHRLDREASGLLVLARNDPAFHALKEQFYKHSVTRIYDVLVRGVPAKPAGRLEHLLREDERTGKVQIIKRGEGRHAVLHYETVAALMGGSVAHLRCQLETGRKHQIRVQLKALGHPVLGDALYGRKEDDLLGRLALHASVLGFEHPRTKRPVRFDCPLPRVFARVS